MKKILPLLMLCFYSNCFSQSNSFLYEQVATGQGLSQLSVKNIVQDYLGFMWFCTDDGLNRFDGYTCKVYGYNPGDTNGIKTNIITDVCEDNYKNLWVGTQGGGLYKYNRENDKFIFFDLDSAGIDKKTKLIYTLFAQGKYLWIGTREGGVIKLNLETEHVESYINKDKGLKSNFVTYIKGDSKGNLWAATSGIGLYKFSNLENSVPDIQLIIKNRAIFGIDIDHNGFVWAAASDHKILKINPSSGETKIYTYNEQDGGEQKPVTVFSVTANKEAENIWAGTSGYLLKYDSSKDKFLPYLINSENIFSKSLIRTLYFSNDNNILWAGTISDGAYKIDLSPPKFHSYLDDSQIGAAVPVMAIIQDKENYFWAGTFGSGLYMLDSNKNIIKAFHQNDPSKKTYVYCLLEDNKGNVWYGTVLNGLFKYDKKNKTTKSYSAHNSNLKSTGISYLYQDKENNIWAGTHAVGLFKYNEETDDFIDVDSTESIGFKVSGKGITCIYNDSRGNLWIATDSKGIDRIDLKTGRHYNYQNNDKDNLSLNYTVSIKEDSKKNLWVGTYGGGLNKFNYETQTFTYYTTKDGLPNNSVYAIEEDNSDYLWLSTNNGISRFDPEKEIFTNFSTEDGLPYKEFVQNAVCKTNSEKITFGSVNGFIEFDPSKFSNSNINYRIVSTNFTIGNKAVPIKNNSQLEKSITVAEKIDLSYLDNIFEFEFVALNFNVQRSIRYAYKMENFDNNWIITTPDKRFATYTNLDPGDYNFKVKVVDRSGNFSQNEASVLVTISPPFWETWWFYILVLITIASILYSIYRYRINKILELERLRVGIASDLHDDIGATLTKLALKADMIQYGLDTEDKISGLKRISEMSRQAVSTMSDIVWSIDSRNDSFESMINKMKDFAFGVLADKEIKVQFNAESLDESEKAPIALRQNLYLIFKEAINNIAKHSDAKEVIINFTANDNNFNLRIFDNGTNFKEKEFNVGHGLKNMKMRAEKINADLNYEKDNGFIIIIKGKLRK